MLRTKNRRINQDSAVIISEQDGRIAFSSSPGNVPGREGRFERLLDVNEVAEMLGVSDQMVYKMAKLGEIPHVRIGKRIKFRREDVVKYIKDNLIGDKEEKDE